MCINHVVYTYLIKDLINILIEVLVHDKITIVTETSGVYIEPFA
jgi:hypothetical protein